MASISSEATENINLHTHAPTTGRPDWVCRLEPRSDTDDNDKGYIGYGQTLYWLPSAGVLNYSVGGRDGMARS